MVFLGPLTKEDAIAMGYVPHRPPPTDPNQMPPSAPAGSNIDFGERVPAPWKCPAWLRRIGRWMQKHRSYFFNIPSPIEPPLDLRWVQLTPYRPYLWMENPPESTENP